MNDVKTTLKKAADQMTETSRQLADRAKETANSVAERSKDAIDAISQNASDAAAFLGKQGENATDAVSQGFKATARTIRDHVPGEGPVKDAAFGVAQQFSNAAGYLDERGMEGLVADISTVIKRSPLATVAAGLGVGFLLGLTQRPKT